MDELLWETPNETIKNLALKVKNIRKRKKMTQLQLSKKSNVSYGSIKRFESTGEISLLHLTQISIALNCVEEIRNLFNNVTYTSIEEIINGNK